MHRLSTCRTVLARPKWAVYRGEYLHGGMRGTAYRAFSLSQLKLTAPQKHVEFRQRRDAVQGSGAPTRKKPFSYATPPRGRCAGSLRHHHVPYGDGGPGRQSPVGFLPSRALFGTFSRERKYNQPPRQQSQPPADRQNQITSPGWAPHARSSWR